jgi:hypothetical protein
MKTAIVALVSFVTGLCIGLAVSEEDIVHSLSNDERENRERIIELQEEKAELHDRFNALLADFQDVRSNAMRPNPRGLGVSQEEFVDRLKVDGLAFVSLEEAVPRSEFPSAPRLRGKSAADGTILDLVGPWTELSAASLIVRSGDELPNQPMRWLRGFVRALAPDWNDPDDWLENAINKSDLSTSVSTIRGDIRFTVGGSREQGLIFIDADQEWERSYHSEEIPNAKPF